LPLDSCRRRTDFPEQIRDFPGRIVFLRSSIRCQKLWQLIFPILKSRKLSYNLSLSTLFKHLRGPWRPFQNFRCPPSNKRLHRALKVKNHCFSVSFCPSFSLLIFLSPICKLRRIPDLSICFRPNTNNSEIFGKIPNTKISYYSFHSNR
jgi:hypothetical protein